MSTPAPVLLLTGPLLGLALACATAAPIPAAPPTDEPVEQRAPETGTRTWLGPTLWGNRLQDWRSDADWIECVTPSSSRGGWLPVRTAHELSRRIDGRRGAFRIEAEVRRLAAEGTPADDAVGGFLLAAGGPEMDPRSAALIHQWAGNGAGYLVGLDAQGSLVVRDHSRAEDPGLVTSAPAVGPLPERFTLTVTGEVLDAERMRLIVWATDPERAAILATAARDVARGDLVGNVAYLSHPGTRAEGRAPARFGFRDLAVTGAGAVVDPAAALGAVVGAQYTLSRGVLKLTAQLMPMGATDPATARLDVWRAGGWTELASAPIVTPGWTATFRVADWDDTKAVPYRVRYALPWRADQDQALTYTWQGSVAADPGDADEVVLAVLNCNHNNSHAIGGGWGLGEASDRTAPNDWVRGMWFPHAEIVASVEARDPDVLFFAGDQIYEGKSPSFADRQNITLDYLYKWTLFLWAYRDLIATRPTVTIPDDHDVYQGNLWGAGGRKTPGRDNEGGYVHPASFVQMVERTQTSHLPDPFDPTPVEQGIGVYYSHLLWGGVSFAILEDRKFKSGCKGILPPEVTPNRPDHVIDPSWDPSVADVAGLELLGARQEEFLEAWGADWDGAAMKAVLSQSPFGCLSTHHAAGLVRYEADMDANGWPQAGRRRALERIRAAKAVHVTGDQHLATVVRHGIDAHGDGPWSFTGPAIANFYPRAWAPHVAGAYQPVPLEECLGDFTDGFGNKVTMVAVANPGTIDRPEVPSDLYDRMAGFGAVVFDKAAGTVTFECWPRGVDPTAADAWQYAGWPVTVTP